MAITLDKIKELRIGYLNPIEFYTKPNLKSIKNPTDADKELIRNIGYFKDVTQTSEGYELKYTLQSVNIWASKSLQPKIYSKKFSEIEYITKA